MLSIIGLTYKEKHTYTKTQGHSKATPEHFDTTDKLQYGSFNEIADGCLQLRSSTLLSWADVAIASWPQ